MKNVDPAHSRHAQVKQRAIDRVAAKPVQCFFAASGGANHLQTRLSSQQRGQSDSNHGMIIHDKNSNAVAGLVAHDADTPTIVSRSYSPMRRCCPAVAEPL